MADGDGRDEMIEIGDPTIEPAVPEPTHQVVIQYRDRGIPWMLLPALLMLSAIATVYAYRKLQPPPHRPSPTVAVAVPEEPEVARPVEAKEAEPVPAPVVPPVVAPVEPVPQSVATPEAVPTPTPMPVEPPVAPEESRPPPKVQDLGFDRNAFLTDPRANDPAVSPASQDPAKGDPASPPVVDPNTLPVEVDPDDLPPDPRKAREIRANRAVEAKKRADDERGDFHAGLRAIVRKPGKNPGERIALLCQEFGTDVDPVAKQMAAKHLGKSGAYAGASRQVRIKLLRKLGFPEPLILRDLFEQTTSYLDPSSRTGWKTDDDAWVHIASIFLNYPPAPPASPPTTAPKTKAAADTGRPGSMLLRDNPGR